MRYEEDSQLSFSTARVKVDGRPDDLGGWRVPSSTIDGGIRSGYPWAS